MQELGINNVSSKQSIKMLQKEVDRVKKNRQRPKIKVRKTRPGSPENLVYGQDSYLFTQTIIVATNWKVDRWKLYDRIEVMDKIKICELTGIEDIPKPETVEMIKLISSLPHGTIVSAIVDGRKFKGFQDKKKGEEARCLQKCHFNCDGS